MNPLLVITAVEKFGRHLVLVNKVTIPNAPRPVEVIRKFR